MQGARSSYDETGASITHVDAPAQLAPLEYAQALVAARDRYDTDLSAWDRQNWIRQQQQAQQWRPPVIPQGGLLGAAPSRGRAPVRPAESRMPTGERPAAPFHANVRPASENIGGYMRPTFAGGTFSGYQPDYDAMPPALRALYMAQDSRFAPGGAAATGSGGGGDNGGYRTAAAPAPAPPHQPGVFTIYGDDRPSTYWAPGQS